MNRTRFVWRRGVRRRFALAGGRHREDVAPFNWESKGRIRGSSETALIRPGRPPLSRLLTNLLYGISSSDPLTYFSAGGLLLVIGAAASAYPAWRAATRDPLPTLRAE